MREASEHKFGGGGGGGREDVSSKDLEFGVTGDGGKNYFELRVGNGTGGVLGGRNWGLADRGMCVSHGSGRPVAVLGPLCQCLSRTPPQSMPVEIAIRANKNVSNGDTAILDACGVARLKVTAPSPAAHGRCATAPK